MKIASRPYIMLLLNPLRLPILLTMFLSACASPLANPDSNPGITISPSYSLHHHPRGLKRNIPSTSHRFTMGPYKVFILKSIALMPVITAAEEMHDFFTVVSQAGSIQKLAGRVTDHYGFGFGAIKMLFNTLPAAPNQAPPPLNWDLVMWIGSQLLQMTNLGWTDHFAALFWILRRMCRLW